MKMMAFFSICEKLFNILVQSIFTIRIYNLDLKKYWNKVENEWDATVQVN